MRGEIDLQDMLVFAQVADSLGFTAAASILGIPKSTVSRRIAGLEEALGVRLLQRTTRKLSLTDVGAAYAERCRGIRADVEEANLAVASAGEHPRGRLRITSAIEIGRRYIAPVLAEYGRRYEAVELELELSDHARDLVAEGFDLAIRIGPLADSTLIARSLGTTQQVVCAAPAYLERSGEPLHPEDLGSHDTIVMTSGIGGFEWAFVGPDGELSLEVQPRTVANDFSAVCQLAIEGLGIARLPSWVAHDAIARGELRGLLPGYEPNELAIHAVYPTRRQLSAKLQTFLDLLLERLTPAPWTLS